MPLPLDAPPEAWIYLSLSAIVGFVIADYFLFNAYILIGSRLTVLFQPLSPLFTALLGFVILGERMRPAALIAMGVVVTGILVVVMARGKAKEADAGKGRPHPHLLKGFVFALLSVFFNALGLILSKRGLSGGYDAVSGTQIRVMTAILGFGLQALLVGKAREVFVEAPRDRTARIVTPAGAVFGPFLGVVMSLYAIQHTSAGAASTLMALTPVLIIAPAIVIQKQKIHPLEFVGAAIAVAGAALFFLL